MDTNSLVENLIDDGQKLLEHLPRAGFEVTASFWLRRAEDGDWRFYIATPEVERQGIAPAYRALHTEVRRMPQPFWIDPLEVKLIGETSPITRDVLAIHARSGGARACPVHWGGKMLGNVSVEGVYLYPLPAKAAH